jgi:hypothetical protein
MATGTISSLVRWAKAHPATSVMAAGQVLVSLLLKPFTGRVPRALRIIATFNVTNLVANILFIVLLSGIEASVGRANFALWMGWSALVLAAARGRLGRGSSGPTFAVFCPFLTFATVHRASFHFRIRRFRFDDSLLYSIAFCQFIFLDITGHCFDFVVCVLANISWRFINSIIITRIISVAPRQTPPFVPDVAD